MTFNDFIEILIYAIALEVIITNVHSLIKDYKLRLDERAILNHYGITEQVAKRIFWKRWQTWK